MKPQRFEIGQAVVIKREAMTEPRHKDFTAKVSPADIYHISAYKWSDILQEWYCRLKEWPHNHLIKEILLDPVDLTSEHIEALVEESLTQPVG